MQWAIPVSSPDPISDRRAIISNPGVSGFLRAKSQISALCGKSAGEIVRWIDSVIVAGQPAIINEQGFSLDAARLIWFPLALNFRYEV